jgi:hypothetical protein
VTSLRTRVWGSVTAVGGAPGELVEVPKAYRRMSRYGPVLLCAVGVGMVAGGMLLDRPTAVLVTLIVMGVGSVVAGVLLPRIRGPVEVGTQGVKAAVESVQAIDAIKTIVAAAAETVAETTIPDQPDKAAKVAKQVDLILKAVTYWLERQPRPVGMLYDMLRHPSTSTHFGDVDPELAEIYARFMGAVAELSEAEEKP